MTPKINFTAYSWFWHKKRDKLLTVFLIPVKNTYYVPKILQFNYDRHNNTDLRNFKRSFHWIVHYVTSTSTCNYYLMEIAQLLNGNSTYIKLKFNKLDGHDIFSWVHKILNHGTKLKQDVVKVYIWPNALIYHLISVLSLKASGRPPRQWPTQI